MYAALSPRPENLCVAAEPEKERALAEVQQASGQAQSLAFCCAVALQPA